MFKEEKRAGWHRNYDRSGIRPPHDSLQSGSVITRVYRENKPERPRIPHVFPAYPESKRINQPPVSFPTTLIRLLDSGHPTTSRSIILLYRERRRVQGFNTHTP
jgi:hypothetical protein